MRRGGDDSAGDAVARHLRHQNGRCDAGTDRTDRLVMLICAVVISDSTQRVWTSSASSDSASSADSRGALRRSPAGLSLCFHNMSKLFSHSNA
jgi:hypothetical protein